MRRFRTEMHQNVLAVGIPRPVAAAKEEETERGGTASKRGRGGKWKVRGGKKGEEKGKYKGDLPPPRRGINAADTLRISQQSSGTIGHRRSQRGCRCPRTNIPSKLAEFAGLASCCYMHYASKMHHNIPFPDRRTHFSREGA